MISMTQPMVSLTDPPAPIRGAIAVAATIGDLLQDEPQALAAYCHFPRDMAFIATYGLGLPILARPALRLRDSLDYLRLLGAVVGDDEYSLPDRRLFGLLHVGPPMNLILLDAALPARSVSWVLAHELSHFLSDIWRIRSIWERRFTGRADAVRRAFAWHERDDRLDLHAALAGLPSRPATALARCGTRMGEVAQRESNADLIARELLAPWADAAKLAGDLITAGAVGRNHDEPLDEPLVDALGTTFGLLLRSARHYAWDLRRVALPRPNPIMRLFG